MIGNLFGLNTLGTVVDLAANSVKEFAYRPEVADKISALNTQVVEKLSTTPGMTQSRGTKFKKATPIFNLKDGTVVKTYRNSLGVNYVFLADLKGKMLFGGYVGWIHSDGLAATIAEIKSTFT